MQRVILLLTPLGSVSPASTVLSNTTQCEACPLCEACRSCTTSIILAFAITAIATTLLLAMIYVPVLIAVFKSYSKIVPDIIKTGGENKIHERINEDLARGGEQGPISERREGGDTGGILEEVGGVVKSKGE